MSDRNNTALPNGYKPDRGDERKAWLDTHGGRGLLAAQFGQRWRYGLQNYGMAKTLRLAATSPYRRVMTRLRLHVDGRIDRLYGTETQGRIPLSAFAFESTNKALAQPYEPTPARSFRKLMTYLPRSLSSFTFIDFGCGKGRTLLYASSYDFVEIVGVEFSPQLAKIATDNAAKLAAMTGDTRLKVVCADATSFEPPPTPLVCFLYSPFAAEDLYRALGRNFLASFRARPRKIFIVLYNSKRWGVAFAEFEFLRRRTQGTVRFDLAAPAKYSFTVFETRDE